MPVHPTAGGFQFGNTGKVFRSKAKAEAQARAIYATGWRENGAAHRQAHVALSPSRKAELAYTHALLNIMGALYRGVLHVVHREHLGIPGDPELRHDADNVGLGDSLLRKMLRFVKPHVEQSFDRMAGDSDRQLGENMRLVGIRPQLVPGLAKVIDRARTQNVELITRASRDFLDDVRDTLDDMEGDRPEDIAAALEDRVKVSKSRATLIAVDQTLKMHAALSQERMKAAGVDRYRWSTSLDERVRPTHAALQGQVFSWDDPPETNDDGDTNNPGEDYRCRCVAIPVFDEGVGEEEETEAEEPDEELGQAAE